MHHLIPRVLDLETRNKMGFDRHQIKNSGKWEIYVKYRQIVSRFLTDRTRSGSLFVGQRSYVDLAIYLARFLTEELQWASLTPVFPWILSNFSPDIYENTKLIYHAPSSSFYRWYFPKPHHRITWKTFWNLGHSASTLGFQSNAHKKIGVNSTHLPTRLASWLRRAMLLGWCLSRLSQGLVQRLGYHQGQAALIQRRGSKCQGSLKGCSGTSNHRGTTGTFIDGGTCSSSILSILPAWIVYSRKFIYFLSMWTLFKFKLHTLGLAHHYLEGN